MAEIRSKSAVASLLYISDHNQEDNPPLFWLPRFRVSIFNLPLFHSLLFHAITPRGPRRWSTARRSSQYRIEQSVISGLLMRIWAYVLWEPSTASFHLILTLCSASTALARLAPAIGGIFHDIPPGDESARTSSHGPIALCIRTVAIRIEDVGRFHCVIHAGWEHAAGVHVQWKGNVFRLPRRPSRDRYFF